MGQAHNLNPHLFDVTPYTQGVEHGPPAPMRENFEKRLDMAEDMGTQLRMYEQAGVLNRSHSSELGGRARGPFVERKLEQSKREAPTGSGQGASKGENTTYESIKKYGVRTPVLVSQIDDLPDMEGRRGRPSYELQHGHHRVYSANEINPQMEIPLVHTLGRYSGDRYKDEHRAMTQSASQMSMGGEYVEGGWTDPTALPRYRILT